MMDPHSAPAAITAPLGFHAAATACGIKASGKSDLAMIVSDRPCAAAGVFTQSRTLAAPVTVNRRHLASGRCRAVIVNSGNANAATGAAGEDDARAMCRLTAEALRQVDASATAANDDALETESVLVCSTGIIGHPLPMTKIEKGVGTLAAQLARGPDADAAAATAILTTDLVAKTAHREIEIDGRRVQIGGMCKGSGMIAPNMATMLAFITTDAAVAPSLLQAALREAVAASFNRISVDQHTSPSDTVLILANGAAGNAVLDADRNDATTERFRRALTDLCRDLAYQVVKDGEGATKVFRVRVTGAATETEADRVGKAVVDSPLVKTAVHGGDPNWGRIITAAGYSGARMDAKRMALSIGATGEATAPIRVYTRGAPETLAGDQQHRLDAAMRETDVTFTLDLGWGDATVEWLGCDLSRQYVAINADYTT